MTQSATHAEQAEARFSREDRWGLGIVLGVFAFSFVAVNLRSDYKNPDYTAQKSIHAALFKAAAQIDEHGRCELGRLNGFSSYNWEGSLFFNRPAGEGKFVPEITGIFLNDGAKPVNNEFKLSRVTLTMRGRDPATGYSDEIFVTPISCVPTVTVQPLNPG